MSKAKVDLGKNSVGKLLISLSVPAIIAQLVNVLYNIVDRVFIGRIPEVGETAMAGVGVAFPIIIIISAFSSLIGGGGAPLVAIKMGEKNNDGAEKIVSNSFVTLIIISILLTVGFFIFKYTLTKTYRKYQLGGNNYENVKNVYANIKRSSIRCRNNKSPINVKIRNDKKNGLRSV